MYDITSYNYKLNQSYAAIRHERRACVCAQQDTYIALCIQLLGRQVDERWWVGGPTCVGGRWESTPVDSRLEFTGSRYSELGPMRESIS